MLLTSLFLFALLQVALALTYRAADISSLIVVEESGVTYSYDDVEKPFEDILRNNGMNAARIRVWTSGQYDLDYGLALAKRIRAAGMILHIDLHYSDTWADPGHQAIPAGWPTNLTGLVSEIYSYTQNVVESFAAQDTPIDILQVGNEINNGLLWPVGEVSVNGLAPVSQLLHSAIQGGLAANTSYPKPATLIHLANGWDWADLGYFYSGVFNSDALTPDEVDIMGVSFYPFYGANATLEALQSSLTNLAHAWGKTIVVAETDWPALPCDNVTLSEPIPASVTGQEIWTSGIRDVLESLPDGRGQGIYYWEPGWVGNAALGSSCADNLLVTSSGAARQSISMFGADM